MAGTTTIQVSEEIRDALAKRRIYEKETYEEVIMDLLEDSMELSAETLKELEQSRKDIEAGRVYTLEEVKKKLGY